MLNKRLANFAEMVWGAAARFGRDPSKITDDIIRRAFPRTCEEAEVEGADKMLRVGVTKEVRRIVSHGDPGQLDFSDIEPSYRDIVSRLKKAAYFVESVGKYVPVPDLINTPSMLDDARKLMRRKGEECLAEAQVLDELYEAINAPNPEKDAAA